MGKYFLVYANVEKIPGKAMELCHCVLKQYEHYDNCKDVIQFSPKTILIRLCVIFTFFSHLE